MHKTIVSLSALVSCWAFELFPDLDVNSAAVNIGEHGSFRWCMKKQSKGMMIHENNKAVDSDHRSKLLRGKRIHGLKRSNDSMRGNAMVSTHAYQ